MKAEPQKPKPAFSPITITLETPEEVAAVYALVNHRRIADAVGLGLDDDTWPRRIREANEAAGNARIDRDLYDRNLHALVK